LKESCRSVRPSFRQYVSFQDILRRCGSGPPHYRRFTITLRHATLGRTPLDEWTDRRRGLSTWQYTTHTRDRHPCRQRNSNPQSQQVSSRRPTP